MAAPGAVTLLLVLAAVAPSLLVDGCPNGCPDGYQPCGGHCYKRIEQVVNFWTAAGLCEAESTRLSGGDTKYIAIPSPWNQAENDCVKKFAREAAVWLGYIEIDKDDFIYRDYKHQWYMFWDSYTDWASRQPSHFWEPSWFWWLQSEYHIVLIPVSYSMDPGWHDWQESGPFHPLCATRYCR